MIELRDYQGFAISLTLEWMYSNIGNPCIVLPTGSGKSVVIAALCHQAITSWPDTRILKITGRKELIQQNAEKLLTYWPNAPLGIYSAGMNRRQIDQITFAGIQSIRSRASEIGRIDICIIDEAHEISHHEEGAYRTIINDLLLINPNMRVIGLTASPYRLGHGMITDKPAIFDELIEPTSIIELQARGYLAKLTSKSTKKMLSVDGIHKRGGEYIESELQAMVDTDLNNQEAVEETIARAGDRRAWLFFCSGVDHAIHIRDLLRNKSIAAETVTGDTPGVERDRILRDYKSGKIKAITNNSVLTTGFDYPDIDLIVFLRPTMSAGLYYQMAGRGLRPKSHGGDCLVLDFAGIVQQHGPITAIKPPKSKGNGDGVAPSKICPECEEIIAVQCKTCPECGYIFPQEEKDQTWNLHNDDIMGGPSDPIEMEVYSWGWDIQKSKKSGLDMVVVSYYGNGIAGRICEYLCIYHDGFAGKKGLKTLNDIIAEADAGDISDPLDMQNVSPPDRIVYIMDGKFPKILSRHWDHLQKFEDDIPF